MKTRRLSLNIGLIVLCHLMMANVAMAMSGLTLNQLNQLAIQNNKDLKAAKYNVTLATARLVQAGLWPNPNLNLADTTDRAFSNQGEYTRSVGFSQAFPIAGRIGRQKDVARVDVAIAMAEIKDAERKLKGEVATGFYVLVITDHRLQQLNSLLSISEKLMRVTHKRYHAAEVSELDANTAKLEYQRLLQEKRVLESQRISQIVQLNQLLGRSPTTPLRVNETIPRSVQLPKLPALQEAAIQQRPDMQATWLNLNRAQAAQQLARAERWADWTIGLGFEQSKLVVDGAPPQKSNRALSLNLSIPLPLLNSNQGRIAEAGAAGTQAHMKLQALKLTIEAEVASNYGLLQSLQRVLQSSQSNSLTLTARNVKLAREAYNNGQISLMEVVQAQRQQNDLQIAYLNTLDQYLQALVKLQIAMGGDLNRYHLICAEDND
jgi:cobalt-zinc-cadmium efflux system outer membrane protein